MLTERCRGSVVVGRAAWRRPASVRSRIARVLAMGLGAVAWFGGTVACGDSPATPALRRPNVVVIVADDLGYGDVGYQGSKDIPTPNIDALARHGVRFPQGYVCMPMCAPSRAGLLTGCYPQRFGFEDNPDPVLDPKRGIRPDVATAGDIMGSAGYVTGAIGKWHLGTAEAYRPVRRGFAEFFGYLGGARFYIQPPKLDKPNDPIPQWYLDSTDEPAAFARRPKDPLPEWFINQTLPLLRGNEPVQQEEQYVTEAFTREAVSFIARHKDEPFFLYLAHSEPHHPYEVTEKYRQRVAGIVDRKRMLYAAMVSALDDSVGQVIQALEDNKLDRNTLVVFLSDNGAGNHPAYAGSNAPLRGFKGQHYEGGVRIPFVMQWRGRLPEGVSFNHPVTALDILPTAAALAGASVPPGKQAFDGVDLMPHLLGQNTAPPHERLFWRQGGGEQAAMREGRYKLILGGKDRRNRELYDLDEDMTEKQNLAKSKPEVVERMLAAYEQWDKQMIPPLWRTMR